MTGPVHHLEFWTQDITAAAATFGWLLGALGWRERAVPGWTIGRVWEHEAGPYLVLEQSPAVSGLHDRLRAGLNHLALTAPDVVLLDRLRTEASHHGWQELFADQYPHAGGPGHVALFLANDEGFEVEVVAG